jgi:hydrogenase/urease accessory protein HupE
VLGDYTVLGLEHILIGVDHLLFLLGLMLLVRGWRSLLATVSAFTLAHSVTLSAASVGVVHVSTDPVEIGIALSVLLLGIEAAQRRSSTLTRRFPWLVAFGFGLLHGLGFASALAEVGLPRNAVTLSLLGFNLGVELGQVLVVGVVTGLLRLLAKKERLLSRVEWLAVGALVMCSTYWVLTRIESWLAGAAF